MSKWNHDPESGNVYRVYDHGVSLVIESLDDRSHAVHEYPDIGSDEHFTYYMNGWSLEGLQREVDGAYEGSD